MPKTTVSHAVQIARSPSEIWAMLQDADTWAGIGPVEKVWDPEHQPDGALARYRWQASTGPRRWEGRSTVIESVPGERMVLELKASEMKGTLTAGVAASADGTEVTVELIAESVGMLATLFWPVVEQALASGLPEQLEHWAAGVG